MNPRICLLWAASTILLMLASCASSGRDLPPLRPMQDTSSYQLGPGDKLGIKVLGADELGGQYEVQGDGTIRMLLIGDVPVSGLTVEALEDEIADKLKEGDYLKRPSVSASVLTYRPFYILGEVAKPGAYPYASGMRVLSAVAVAQGYTYRADQNFVIITRNGENSKADAMSSIRPGDIIRVPERYF
jgi:polysaccharide biosynthesis/export protein